MKRRYHSPAETLAAHQRVVRRKREILAAIRRYEQYIPDWNFIARQLRTREGLFKRGARANGDIGLTLSRAWALRGYYESGEAMTKWRKPRHGAWH